ncbi:MAG: hypothetical protein EXQ70_01815 [Solirubrobacterales bacterium]|nr:hypothetical protein [Solirubrobacterales bacterium]
MSARSVRARRELRAEGRARELLLEVAGAEADAMYRELGFLAVDGSDDGYGYLIYPQRPIVAYDAASGELLSEYCVLFREGEVPAKGERLPDADDVLAKWMALSGDERGLIQDANMDPPGRQLDPEMVRRDLKALERWRRTVSSQPAPESAPARERRPL